MKLIKCLLIATLPLCATLLKAESFDSKYSCTIDSFEWRLNKIESKYNYAYIYLTVKNNMQSKRAINCSKGEYVVTNDNPKGIKAISNSVTNPEDSKRFISNNSILILEQGQEIPIVLKFPSESIFNYEEFDLLIGPNYILRRVKVPGFSIADLNEKMQTWKQYYYSHRRVHPSFEKEEDIRKAIQNDVEKWQKKGEFETTSAWKSRVNDKSREAFIRSTSYKYLKILENEQSQIREEQNCLAKDYEKYKEETIKEFYRRKISIAKNKFAKYDFVLMPYDADNETFMIHGDEYGDILLPVPVTEALSFKQNWGSIKTRIMPEFVPNGDKVALTKLTFTNNNKDYIYDSHTQANYAITDVKYNFSPIEMADINIGNIQMDGIFSMPENVSSTVVGKKSSEVLTAQNAKIDKLRISASDRSDIDTEIPENITDRETNTFAIIIANENYTSVSNVPYATNDGDILGRYLTLTVGLPEDHVKIYKDATFGNVAASLKYIENLSKAYKKDLNLIFYYAGHGMPNEKTRNPMILPVDGDVAIPETCYDLGELTSKLGSLNANSIIVMLDACFSGAERGTERGDGMLIAARGVRIKSNQSAPTGNMVILSATQGDETAYPLDSARHGLFTYFLLKKLQETKGDVTLGELADYITEQVKRQSVVSNGKLQTPTVSVSSTMLPSWRNYKIK